MIATTAYHDFRPQRLQLSILRTRVYLYKCLGKIYTDFITDKRYQLRFQMTPNKIHAIFRQYTGFALGLDKLCDTIMLFCFLIIFGGFQ